MASVATVASVNSEDKHANFVMMVCEAYKSFRVSKKSQEKLLPEYFDSLVSEES